MYAQNEEDDFYYKYLDMKKTNGIYIDIGAGEPNRISNTQILYEMGWSGLCVEPNLSYYDSWRQLRPRDLLVTSPIMDRAGKFKMVYGAVMEGSWLYDDYIKKGHQIQEFEAITFEMLLNQYPQFMEPDLFTIDVELSEDKVLATVDFDKFKPHLIIIERCIRGIDSKPKWEHKLLTHYDHVEDFPGNAFYLRKS